MNKCCESLDVEEEEEVENNNKENVNDRGTEEQQYISRQGPVSGLIIVIRFSRDKIYKKFIIHNKC